MPEKNKEMDVESTTKSPMAEVENEVAVAPEGEKSIAAAETEVTPTTPETDGEAPDAEDISDLITLLNEVKAIAGGEGEITEIPEDLRGVLGFITSKMVALRDAFKDPLFKEVLDDMIDQQEDGSMPSLLVAVARNAPMEELQDLADNEKYADVQGAVIERIDKQASDAKAEEDMMANFEESQQAGQEYAEEMGYDDEQSQRLFTSAMKWFKILGDGKITKEEWAKVDKADNYDTDTEELRKQLPTEPIKEIMPDQASMDAAITEKPQVPTRPVPKNSIEGIGAKPGNDWENLGKRKFIGNK